MSPFSFIPGTPNLPSAKAYPAAEVLLIADSF